MQSTTGDKLRNILIPNQLREEMGACNSLFSPKHQDEDAEGRMRVLQEENRKLHEIVSSLQMELHQQRSEVMRMTYMLKEEQHLASTYKTGYWRLRIRVVLRQNIDSRVSENLQPCKSWNCQNHWRSCLIANFVHDMFTNCPQSVLLSRRFEH